MKKSAILAIQFATIISACSASRAEEAYPRTSIGELSSMKKISDTCSEVFKMGEHHQSRGRIVSALDSFAWVIVNLPPAPILKDLRTRTYQSFVLAINSADRQDIRIFGDQRAERYLERILSDHTLPEDIRTRAQNVRDRISSAEKDTIFKEARTKKEGEQAGTGQSAIRPESKSEGSDKPQPEAERRSQ